jgi:hypothetical protein
MMNYSKMLKICSAVLAVLIIILCLTVFTNPKDKAKEQEIISVNDISVAEIIAVGVTNEKATFGLMVGENGITLESDNGKEDYAQTEMQAFIYTISKLKADKAIKDYDDLMGYGLDEPQAVMVVIKKDGTKLRYALGSKNALDGRYYLQKEGEDIVYLISQSDGDMFLMRESDFIQKAILPRIMPEEVDLLDFITISRKSHPDRTYTIKNNKEYTFVLTSPIDNTMSTDSVFSEIVLPLSGLYPDKVIDSEGDFADYGLDDPDYTFTLGYDGKSYTVIASKADDQSYYIANSSAKAIYSITNDKIAFLDKDYIDLLGDSVYSCNVAKVGTIVFSDKKANTDYNLDITGQATEIKGIIDDKTVAYKELMAFYRLVTSIGMAKETKDEVNKEPYFTITVNKRNGSIDLIEFIEKDVNESYVRINANVNFTTYNKAAMDIMDAIYTITN